MDLVLFGVFFIVALAFFSLGKVFRAFFFVAGAGLLLSVLGVISITGEGLYYQVVNETATDYSFSSDYFEFANDSVQCHNCTAYSFNDSYNATPPGCCEHDVNTTISGSVSEAKTFSWARIELDSQQSLVISVSFVLFGLAAFLETGLQYLRDRKKGVDGGG